MGGGPGASDFVATNSANSVLFTVLAGILYMVVGPALILNNRHILVDLAFPFPVFVSSLGLITTALVTWLRVNVEPPKIMGELGIERLEIDAEKAALVKESGFWMKNIMPTGVCTALTLSFGNAVYLYLSVSFIQMLKAFTPVIVVILLLVSEIERPSVRSTAAVAVMCVGTAIASYGEIHFVVFGVLLMFASELCEGTRLVLQQKTLQNLNFSVIESQYFMAPAAAICMTFLSVLTEWKPMLEGGHLRTIWLHLPYFVAASCLGLVINFVSFLVIQITNSVSLKILGTLRNALLIFFSVFFLDEMVTEMQFVGYAITIVGFVAYVYIKTTERTSVAPTELSKIISKS